MIYEFLRTCSHRGDVRIFEHNYAEDKAKSRSNTCCIARLFNAVISKNLPKRRAAKPMRKSSMSAPVPRARGDDIFTAIFDADTNRKGKFAVCKLTQESSKS